MSREVVNCKRANSRCLNFYGTFWKIYSSLKYIFVEGVVSIVDGEGYRPPANPSPSPTQNVTETMYIRTIKEIADVLLFG